MRFLFVVLFMVLATHVSAQEAQGVTAKAPSQQEGKDGKASDAQTRANEPPIPVRIIESPDDTQRTRDREAASDKHDSDDLKAQQKAADAADRAATATERQVVTAWWQVGVGIAGIIAILVTIGFTIRATNAAVRSANHADESARVAEKALLVSEKIANKQLRAYIDVADIKMEGDLFSPTIFISIKNFGQTPAEGFKCRYAFDIGYDPLPEPVLGKMATGRRAPACTRK
ncbi:hypothetical protein ACFX5Q_31520 [Mesorhizobium sp. IMUNJ 23033]|uniref:hypothetical protein n=1 Tax=Mesorhizobium sp. IMUNJ 23033 TaxID=3378039 RepID=UPI00384FBB3A